jgi:hypothetical protein
MNVHVNQVIGMIEEVYNQLATSSDVEDRTEDYAIGIDDFRNVALSKIDELFIVRECRACKETFYITKAEADWLKENGLKLFTHCRDCRERRRREKELAEQLGIKIINY